MHWVEGVVSACLLLQRRAGGQRTVSEENYKSHESARIGFV